MTELSKLDSWRGKRFLSSPKRPEYFCDPLNLYSTGIGGASLRDRTVGA